MIEPISFLTVIGLSLGAFILVLQWWTKRQDLKQKRTDQIDTEINNASGADALFKLFDRLRGK